MKRDLEFNEPIAERIIKGNDCTLIVQLGPPRPETTEGHTGWYCPYRIKGFPDKPDHEMFGGGEDAIDAIIYALANIEAYSGPGTTEGGRVSYLRQRKTVRPS
jgi:hypothetical protein